MTQPVLQRALACAERGWPVFPCQPGRKTPATPHGYLDATTDPARSATGSAATPAGTSPSPPAPPAPTSSTSTTAARPAAGSPPWPGCAPPGCWTGPPPASAPPAAACTSTSPAPASAAATCPPATSTSSPRRLRPDPALPGRRQPLPATSRHPGGHGRLDWARRRRLLEPSRERRGPRPGPAAEQAGALARWVAAQPEGNRNTGLFWAANRALEADQAADLSPLAAAARQAGLDDRRSPGPSTPPAAPARPARRTSRPPARRSQLMTSTRPAAPATSTATAPAAPRSTSATATSGARSGGCAPRAAPTGPSRPPPDSPPPPCTTWPPDAATPPRRPQAIAAVTSDVTAPRPRRCRRHPAAAAGPARHGPRLGPHRPRPRRPRDDRPRHRPR